MIKNVMVYNQQTMKLILSGRGKLSYNEWALITISEPGEGDLIKDCEDCKKLARQNCYEHLSLIFHDINSEQRAALLSEDSNDRFIYFDKNMGQQILDFLNKIQGMRIEGLVVQCNAGISRSGAVGIFACRYYGLNETQFRESNKYLAPNTLVYDTLVDLSGMREEYASWWDDFGKDN